MIYAREVYISSTVEQKVAHGLPYVLGQNAESTHVKISKKVKFELEDTRDVDLPRHIDEYQDPDKVPFSPTSKHRILHIGTATRIFTKYEHPFNSKPGDEPPTCP